MALYSSGESVNAVVAEIGAWSTKIGYAGEDYPRSHFRSVGCCEEVLQDDPVSVMGINLEWTWVHFDSNDTSLPLTTLLLACALTLYIDRMLPS